MKSFPTQPRSAVSVAFLTGIRPHSALSVLIACTCALAILSHADGMVPTAHAQTHTTASTPATDAGGQFAAAFSLFSRAAGGDTTSIEPAAEAFAALLRQQPGDGVLMAYSGSATAMRARTTMLPWKKMGFADDGLAQIDKALALLSPTHNAISLRGVPAVLEIKFTAASTFLALPAMFNRQERGLKLLAEVANHAQLKNCPAEFQNAVAAAQRKQQER